MIISLENKISLNSGIKKKKKLIAISFRLVVREVGGSEKFHRV